MFLNLLFEWSLILKRFVFTGRDEKSVMAEFHKLSKNYKKAFDAVLQGSFAEALPVLIEYLNFLDQVSFEISY